MAQRDFIWWNDERILHLIELYRRKPVIWDPKHEDYYKKNLKLDAWEDIGRALGISGDDCKNKMVNVLSSWRRERGKENKKTDEVYKSHWFAYNALRFLKDREMPRKGLCKSVTLQIASSSETDPRTSTEPPEDFQRNKRPLSTSPPEVTPPEPKRQTLIPPPTRTFQEPTRRSTPQPTWYPPQTSSGCQYQDEFSTFGQHVANQLRCLPLGNAIVCQNYINNYLAEERLKVINEGCGYYRHDAVPTTSRCVADDRNVGTVDYHHHASATASNSSMEPMEDFLDDFSSDQKLDFIKVEDNSDDLL